MAGGGDDCGAGGDFRSKPDNSNNIEEQLEETPNEHRNSEYVRSLLGEKLSIDKEKHPIAAKLVDQEITRTQTEGRGPRRDPKFVNVYREKPIKVAVKVLVPLKEHPKFNFMGKLLGPKGNSLKRLQEDTMCRMAILGRGSIKDKDKEEELRNSLDIKYAHLADDLHVEISALAPPSEAYARLAFALSEIRKYLIPDGADDISQGQLQEMEGYEQGPTGPKGRRPALLGRPPMRGQSSRSSMPMRSATRMPVSGPRGMSGNSNVMSILDRARAAMDNSYEEPYEESYEPEPLFNDYQSSGSRSGFGGNRFGSSNYDDDYYGGARNNYSENQRWKPYNKTGGAAARVEQPRYRAPYSRGGK